MKLYSGPLSLFTAKVRIALAEKGLDYERVEAGWSPKDRYLPHHPDVAALNPKAEVPVLVDGDVVVYDSTVVLEYLEDCYPEVPLYPKDAADRARCRQLEAAADEIIFPSLWDLIEEAFYPAADGGRDTARIERARESFAGHFSKLDKELSGRQHLCGEFSAADIGTFIMVSTAATLGAPPDGSTAELQRWLGLVGARPAVSAEIQAMQAFAAQQLASSP